MFAVFRTKIKEYPVRSLSNHVFFHSNHSFATCLGHLFFLALQRRTWYCSAKQWSRTPCLCVLAQFSSKRGGRNYPPLHISGYFSLKLRVITWFTSRTWTVANLFAVFRTKSQEYPVRSLSNHVCFRSNHSFTTCLGPLRYQT